MWGAGLLVAESEQVAQDCQKIFTSGITLNILAFLERYFLHLVSMRWSKGDLFRAWCISPREIWWRSWWNTNKDGKEKEILKGLWAETLREFKCWEWGRGRSLGWLGFQVWNSLGSSS